MRTLGKIKRLFWSSVVCLTIMSAMFLLMPIVSDTTGKAKAWFYIVGIVFWVSLIAGYCLLGIANKEQRSFVVRKTQQDVSMNCRPGIITFFSNVPGTIADTVFIASLLATVIVCFTKLWGTYVSYILIFLVVISLNLHGLFNGKLYKVVTIKQKGE